MFQRKVSGKEVWYGLKLVGILSDFREITMSGMVVNTCNPNTQEAGQEHCKFEVSLECIARTCLKRKQSKRKKEERIDITRN
jgi:hypothetical protein